MQKLLNPLFIILHVLIDFNRSIPCASISPFKISKQIWEISKKMILNFGFHAKHVKSIGSLQAKAVKSTFTNRCYDWFICSSLKLVDQSGSSTYRQPYTTSLYTFSPA